MVFAMKKTYLAVSLAAATLLLVACGEDSKAKTTSGNDLVASQSQDKAATDVKTDIAKAVDEVKADIDVKDAVAQAADKKIGNDSPFEEKVSYSVGASVGTYIAAMEQEQGEFIGKLDHALVIKGFVESLEKNTSLNEQEITSTLMALDENIRKAVEAKQQQDAQDNLEQGKKFLEDNAKKDNIKITASGLQYEIVKEGSGKTPLANSVVKVKYKGTTIDGQVFDEQTDPIAFPLANIIPGWTEGLQLMKEGGKAKLYIPSDLAYGELGAGEMIKPNSVLIFDIELVEVMPSDSEEEVFEADDAKPSEVAKTSGK